MAENMSSIPRQKSGSWLLHGFAGDYISDLVHTRSQFFEISLLSACRIYLWRRPGIIIDVGANIGNHSIYFAGVLRRKVIALEPYALVSSLLRKNIDANGLGDQITCIEKAAWSHPGTLRLVPASSRNLGRTSVCAIEDEPRDSDIPCTTIDILLAPSNSQKSADTPFVSLIKIDVEGSEIEVIQGALRTIERCRPVIAAETPCPEDVVKVMAVIGPYGYRPVRSFGTTTLTVFLSQPLWMVWIKRFCVRVLLSDRLKMLLRRS